MPSRRQIVARAFGAVVAVAATAFGSAGTAAADDVPRFGLYGDTIHTVGDRNFCRGDVNVRLEAVPGSPGHVLAHVTPLGFDGGPCGVWVHLNYYNLSFPFYQDATVYVWADRGPGETKTVDLLTGSGPNQIAASTWPNANVGVSWVVLVP